MSKHDFSIELGIPQIAEEVGVVETDESEEFKELKKASLKDDIFIESSYRYYEKKEVKNERGIRKSKKHT